MAALRNIDRSRWTTSKALISGTPSTPSELFIAYTRCPPPDGTAKKGTILLIHGYPQFSYQFRHVITPLSDAGYDVIAPDYRGAGNSSKPRAAYTKTALAEDIHKLLQDHLGIAGPVHVVGHDIGGMVAHAYASRYAADTASVTQGEFPLPGTKVYDKFCAENSGVWHFHFHWQADLPEMLTQGRERQYIRHFYDRLAVNPVAITNEDVEVYGQAFERAGAMRAGFDVYRAFHEDAKENRAWVEWEGKCKVPCLCLNGEGSFLANIAKDQGLEAYETVQSATIPGSGHWCAEENPEAFVEKVLWWAGKHTSI